jgi:hypothetical protein
MMRYPWKHGQLLSDECRLPYAPGGHDWCTPSGCWVVAAWPLPAALTWHNHSRYIALFLEQRVTAVPYSRRPYGTLHCPTLRAEGFIGYRTAQKMQRYPLMNYSFCVWTAGRNDDHHNPFLCNKRISSSGLHNIIPFLRIKE